MDARSPRQPADRFAMALGLALLLALFSALLQLLFLRELPPRSGRVDFQGLLDSVEVMTVACVLLAGLLGAHVQFLRERFGVWTATLAEPATPSTNLDTDRDTDAARLWFLLVSQLVMGLGTAGVVALVLPLAIADHPSLSLFNPMGLMALAYASGFFSRHLLGDLQARFERMFVQMQAASGVSGAELGGEVAKSVMQALQPPRPVNYSGSVSLEVRDAAGRACVVAVEGDRSVLVLAAGATYRAIVKFTPRGLSSPASDEHGWQPAGDIVIDDGDNAELVPFNLRLQAGNAAPMDLAVEVGLQAVHESTFSFAHHPPDAESRTQSADEIVLFVYQRTLFCASLEVPVQWQSEP